MTAAALAFMPVGCARGDDQPHEQLLLTRPVRIVAPTLDADQIKSFRPLNGAVPAPFFEAADLTRCREVQPKVCRDLARAEFQLTSLRFMVPDVPGLAPRSLSIRRNSVVANYTFR
jgi:hypothetical protein